MKRITLLSTAAIFLILISLIPVVYYTFLDKNEEQKSFYVGVTFGGNTTQEAKLLVDKVKNYTNLFVLQSGSLRSQNATETIGDYAVANRVTFFVLFKR